MALHDGLPRKPGCYLFKDADGTIIYVGKAKRLRERVAHYSSSQLDPKTAALVSHIASVDFVVTRTEQEAYLYENELIKKHQPRYNINLRDSKGYAYLQVTAEDYPRVVVARRKNAREDIYGPFVSAQERDAVRAFVVKLLRLRTCKRMPKRACLRYHIRLCDAPCIGNISRQSYQERVQRARMILSGKTGELVGELQQEMQEAAKRQDYERAKQLRDTITALERRHERQTVERKRAFNEDIINYMVSDGRVQLLLFNIHKGTLSIKHEFSFEATDRFLEEFILQYYSEEQIPAEIIVPEDVDPALQGYLSEQRGRRVSIRVPQRGEKKKLLDLVRENVEVTFFGDQRKLQALQKALKLKELPARIECFDISHLSGSATVGSMVHFRNGRPFKEEYRRFKVTSVEGVDDYKAIAEVVRRRYRRQVQEGQLPDLVVIDGGKGQLHAAMEALEEEGIRLPVLSIAKRYEEVYVPGLSRPMHVKGEALQLLQAIRDEAHRFAIKYNRQRRSKDVFE